MKEIIIFLKNNIKFLLFFIAIDNLFTLIYSKFIDYFIGVDDVFKGNGNIINNEFYLIVVIIPFFETLIFQLLIIWVLYQITESFKICVIVSALFFSFFHFFNIYYFIAAFGSGLIFAYLFLKIYIESKKWYWAFLFTFFLHFEHNLIAYFLNH